ncbi:MAG: fumarylacetoacetate hydrolase family protein [Rhodocyclaceae bacterium]|nr:fumarylacetoacetate hydrolase family protein [Rhodocyclaceae bacterium]
MLNIVRFELNNATHWGLLDAAQVRTLNLACTTTAELLALPKERLLEAAGGASQPLSGVRLLSPITTPTMVYCQGANYRQHMIDSGMDPDAKRFNMFFTKSAASVTGPTGEIVKPKHVQLLDYEIELTLVMRKATTGPQQVTAENLHEFVAGICIGNDVSARDIQIPQMQFHKGKSYRSFCPLGPVLCLLDKEDMHYLDKLNLELKVNGQIRQSDSTAELVFKPVETLNEFSQIADFAAGDVLMTGTPAGCALGLPSPLMMRIFAMIPEQKKWPLFIKKQSARTQYLKAGDKLELRISSSDGRIDLGVQQHAIVAE